MSDVPHPSNDARTVPVGVTTICPQCGVHLDAVTTTCGACGAVITGSGADGERSERVRAKLQDAIGDAFVLGDLLGRGGMGIVFRAKENALDRDVALKVLAFDPLLNPEAYARFEREAKLAAKLDHPNIVPIFSVGQRNQVAFYTMRMVRGGSVEQAITPGKGFEFGHAIAILRDVAAALDYAHANGVVHRDIKPANILLGDSGHAMVADFGIARAFGGDTGGNTATGTGVVGSPAYMSPEQWRGEKVDGKADQYALAILAFELLTGKRPFADSSMQELLRMHLAEEPPDILSFREDLPSHVTDAIRRAMSKDPVDRFPSAMAFVDAVAGTPGVAPGVVTRPSLSSAAHRASPMSGIAAKATTPMPARGSRPSTGSKRPVRVADADPAPADAPGRRTVWPWVALFVLVAGGLGAMIVQRRQNAAALASAAAVPVAGGIVASGAAAVANDSLTPAERAQAEENAKLQKELDDAKQVALTAEHKVEQMAAADRAAGSSGRSAAGVSHGHLFVVARGGTPSVIVDGHKVADNAPAVVEVPPGHHVVSVKGAQEFVPGQVEVDLAVNDTQQVVFQSKRLAEGLAKPGQFGGRRGGGAAADSTGARGGHGQNAAAGHFAGPTPQKVIERLGFDPQKVSYDSLTPQQQLKLNRFMKQLDSSRAARRQQQP